MKRSSYARYALYLILVFMLSLPALPVLSEDPAVYLNIKELNISEQAPGSYTLYINYQQSTLFSVEQIFIRYPDGTETMLKEVTDLIDGYVSDNIPVNLTVNNTTADYVSVYIKGVLKSAPEPSPSPTPTPIQFAVYSSGDISLSGTSVINGNAGCGSGVVNLTKTDQSNRINGTLYVNTAQATVTAWTSSQIGQIVTNAGLVFSSSIPSIVNAPAIANKGGNATFNYWPVPTPVSQDTDFDSITINSAMTVDVSQKDIYIHTKYLTFNGGDKGLILNGSHKLYLFVDNAIRFNGSVKLNTDGAADNLYIIVDSGDLILDKYIPINGNIFIKHGNVSITRGTVINGNIVSGGGSFASASSGVTINGNIYSPSADASISRGTVVNGSVTVKSLTAAGGTSINYRYYGNIFPNVLLNPVPTPAPTPASTPEICTNQVPVIVQSNGKNPVEISFASSMFGNLFFAGDNMPIRVVISSPIQLDNAALSFSLNEDGTSDLFSEPFLPAVYPSNGGTPLTRLDTCTFAVGTISAGSPHTYILKNVKIKRNLSQIYFSPYIDVKNSVTLSYQYSYNGYVTTVTKKNIINTKVVTRPTLRLN